MPINHLMMTMEETADSDKQESFAADVRQSKKRLIHCLQIKKEFKKTQRSDNASVETT